MDTINFTKTEKDHIEWLVSQHKSWVLDQFNITDGDKERESLMVALKVDQDICDKLWNDKEERLNKACKLKEKVNK